MSLLPGPPVQSGGAAQRHFKPLTQQLQPPRAAAVHRLVDINGQEDSPTEWACEVCGLFQHPDYAVVVHHEAECHAPAPRAAETVPGAALVAHSRGWYDPSADTAPKSPIVGYSTGGRSAGVKLLPWAQPWAPPPPAVPSDVGAARPRQYSGQQIAAPFAQGGQAGGQAGGHASLASTQVPTTILWSQPAVPVGPYGGALLQLQGGYGQPALHGQAQPDSIPSVYSPGPWVYGGNPTNRINQCHQTVFSPFDQSLGRPPVTPTGFQQYGPAVSQARLHPTVHDAGAGVYRVGACARVIEGGMGTNFNCAEERHSPSVFDVECYDWLSPPPLPEPSTDPPLTPHLGLSGGEETETDPYGPGTPGLVCHDNVDPSAGPGRPQFPFQLTARQPWGVVSSVLQSADKRSIKSSTYGFSPAGKQASEGGLRRSSLSTPQMESLQFRGGQPASVRVKRGRGRPRKNPDDPKWHR